MYKVKNINVDEFVGYSLDDYTYFSDGTIMNVKSSDFRKLGKEYKCIVEEDKIFIYLEKIVVEKDEEEKILTFKKVLVEKFHYCKETRKIVECEDSKLLDWILNSANRWDTRDVFSREDGLKMAMFKFVVEVMKEEGVYYKLHDKLNVEDIKVFICSMMKIFKNDSRAVLDFMIEYELYYAIEELINDKEFNMSNYDVNNSQKKGFLKVVKALKNKNYDISVQRIIPITRDFDGNELAILCKFIEVHNEIHDRFGSGDSGKSKDLISILDFIPEINRYTRDFSKFLNYYMKLLFKEGWIDFKYRNSIELTKPLSVYLDYLRVYKSCEECNIFLDDYDLYPNNPKPSHDRLSKILNDYYEEVRQRRALAEEERYANMNKSFMEAVNKYSYLEYSDEDYIVKLPSSMESLRIEGSKLSHCIAGYKYAILDGRSYILFLRRKSHENVPFVTVEVRKDSIWQVRGYDNKDPEKSVFDFVDKWAKERGLKTDSINQYYV